MSFKTVFITGANRGIGLAFVHQLLARGDRVFAACRRPDAAHDLQRLADNHTRKLDILQLDVTDETSIAAAAKQVATGTTRLDWLINNAGYFDRGERWRKLSLAGMTRHLQVNTVGPALVTQALVDLLAAGREPLVVNLSSQLGSIGNRRGTGGGYGYNSSKAALTLLTRMLSFELATRGIRTLAIHPGWVRTDMGGSAAAVTPSDSVAGMLEVIGNLGRQDNGRFLTWQGEALPW